MVLMYVLTNVIVIEYTVGMAVDPGIYKHSRAMITFLVPLTITYKLLIVHFVYWNLYIIYWGIFFWEIYSSK